MSTISVRFPDSLHKRIKSLSEKEHVSMNQLITLAVAEKISVLETEDYLAERAKKGSKDKFLKVLSKVPSNEPQDIDNL